MTTAIDSQGIYYRIPIACINDPSKYSVNKVLEKMQAEKVPDDKKLNVKIRSPKVDCTISISNLSNVEQLKNRFIKEGNLQVGVG